MEERGDEVEKKEGEKDGCEIDGEECEEGAEGEWEGGGREGCRREVGA